MRLAILGGTSEIAKDLILSLRLNNEPYEVDIFSRNKSDFQNWLNLKINSPKFQSKNIIKKNISYG